ncbi:ArsR/SmtB family transcription factor [Kytococcus schroeteri]|uniref:ArsR/SmtB family transcription factor n=1 Tax=Kytococcus schroeteri TaxID=138300 RepID=UPI0011429259|nr:winged helix-turn-helix domain-containing protein [Kytococcus schroeteri]
MAVDRSALAHPVRSRIVAHLRTHGPGTSADLARALDTSTGVTSYHLRLLAEAGLVQDEPGSGRRRTWRLTPPSADGTAPAQAPEDDDTQALDTWLEHDLVDLFATRAHAHVEARAAGTDGRPGPHDVWSHLQDDAVLVSADQAVALRAELDAVLQRYRRLGQGTPGARRVVAWTALLPVD